MNNICTSLGDCGAYVNIAGKATDDGARWSGGSISQGILDEAKSRAGDLIIVIKLISKKR